LRPSDPVSATITSIPAGRAETADAASPARAAELAEYRDYPRVDAALESQASLEPWAYADNCLFITGGLVTRALRGWNESLRATVAWALATLQKLFITKIGSSKSGRARASGHQPSGPWENVS